MRRPPMFKELKKKVEDRRAEMEDAEDKKQGKKGPVKIQRFRYFKIPSENLVFEMPEDVERQSMNFTIKACRQLQNQLDNLKKKNIDYQQLILKFKETVETRMTKLFADQINLMIEDVNSLLKNSEEKFSLFKSTSNNNINQIIQNNKSINEISDIRFKLALSQFNEIIFPFLNVM